MRTKLSARLLLASLAALCLGLFAAPPALAAFGIVPGSLDGGVTDATGKTFSQAGGHPDAAGVSWDFNSIVNEDGSEVSDGSDTKEIVTEVPPGLVGNPLATPRCPRELFFESYCPVSTQVGIAEVKTTVFTPTHLTSPVFNLEAPQGAPAEFGFAPGGAITLARPFLRSDGDYGIDVHVINVPQTSSLLSVSFTLWGNPAAPSHDMERGAYQGDGTTEPYTVCSADPVTGKLTKGPPCPSDAPQTAFLTNPTDCSHGAFDTTVRVTSWAGDEDSQTFTSHDDEGNPLGVTRCDRVPFDPEISATATSHLAESPSGLEFELKMPDSGLLNPDGIAESEPKRAEVLLPKGVTANPSAAEGLAVCTPAQYAKEQVDTLPGEGCPDAAKMGSVEIVTPLLEERARGSLFLAQPDDPATSAHGAENPFDSLLALYMVARVPERGIIVKVAGKVTPDPKTGQLVTTFDNLPQVPFSSFNLHFRPGARAPLATPSSCGTFKTVAKFTPWSAPDEPTTTTSSFTIDHGADGGACPPAGPPPFKPGLVAGTLNNAAGSYSPFNTRLSRSDGEQEFTRFSIKLPPGITGKLAGIPYCPDAAIEAARSRSGAAELASPSCPAASQIGDTFAGAGVGSVLTYAPGKVYLAGPYHGSPISVAAITAAKVGPFDLGTVVVREAFQINPETGEVFIDSTGSDPIPHIIDGIVVHAREIRIHVDRPEFVLNPTDCTPTSTASTVLGSGLDFASDVDDNPITVTSPFQAADCAALPFKPQLTMKLVGGTHRGAHPAFSAHLEMNGIGEAGIASAQVTLPHSEFIENAHFNTICTRVQFKEGAGNGANCPEGSIYGHAKAVTPILSEPLEGPVFLRSSEHQLPDLVVALHNSQVDVDLVGRVDSVKGGGLRNTFEAAPDAPVSSFDIALEGGAKGLFVNSTNLCAKVRKAKADFIGQNGKAFNSNPVLKVKCKGKGKKRKKAHKRHARPAR